MHYVCLRNVASGQVGEHELPLKRAKVLNRMIIIISILQQKTNDHSNDGQQMIQNIESFTVARLFFGGGGDKRDILFRNTL